MGSGFHGGFGDTSGSRYRIGYLVPFTEKTYEMSLNPQLFVQKIIKKYNINLKGSKTKIKIVYNPHLRIGLAGRVKRSSPNIIELGKSAFINEYELANTIAHELNHSRSYLRNGDAPEKTAYKSGNALESYMKGER